MSKKDFSLGKRSMPILPKAENEYQEVAWGLKDYGCKFEPFYINRPLVGDFDVKFEMTFCGICHSDCHIGLNELGNCIYPLVPGHELVGTVVEVG
jgi:D-arabinose 1-dehydrogenase-like Zn-dependent alcohol dehydrogenase